MNNKVKLVGITQSCVDGVDTANDLIAYMARVSNPANQNNQESAPKLVKYLIKHSHWSPFEMVSLVMEINTTRDIARQILRHRSFSFQEFSQRYALATDLGFERREARLQDVKNRQNSIENTDSELDQVWAGQQAEVLKVVQRAYDWAINAGIAKEQARSVLPEGLTQSRMYMSGTLRSWIHYCILRTDVATQKEHREIAQECLTIIKDQFPVLQEVL